MEHGRNMKNKGENSLPNAPITDACNYAFNYVNYDLINSLSFLYSHLSKRRYLINEKCKI